MDSIDALQAATTAAAYLPIGQSYGSKQPNVSASTVVPTPPVDTVDLSAEGKAALEATLAAAQSGSPTQHATPETAAKENRTATGGDGGRDAELLAEATLIGGLLDGNKEEEELMLR